MLPFVPGAEGQCAPLSQRPQLHRRPRQGRRNMPRPRQGREERDGGRDDSGGETESNPTTIRDVVKLTMFAQGNNPYSQKSGEKVCVLITTP